MSETQYARIITKASTGAATIPPSADHSNGDWVSTDIYEHELYLDDATQKLYTNIGGVIYNLNATGSDTNLANADLTQTAATNRTYDINGNLLKFDNGQFEIDGSTGINIVPDGITPAWLTIQSTTTKRPLLVDSTSSANTATFQANSGYAVVASGSGTSVIYGTQNSTGAGVWGDSASGNAVLGTSSGATAVWANGGAVAETWNIGSSRSTKAVLQANSTTQGFLSPRMTTTQRDAITLPDTGLEIYNTTTNRKEVYNGTFWQGTETRFLTIFHGSFSPTDAQTVAFGQAVNAPTVSTNNYFEITMRGNGVIRGCDLTMLVGGVTGSNENWSLYVRHNSTDYLVATVGSTAVVRNFNNTSLNIPYVDGDIVRMVYVNPTWATNPTSVTATGNLILQ